MSCQQCGKCSNACSNNGEVAPEQRVQMPETQKEVVKMRSDFYKMDHLEDV